MEKREWGSASGVRILRLRDYLVQEPEQSICMKRTITGFHRDEEGDWVAELDCGHGQHMRHTPPFFERPWVVTEEGRASRIGVEVDCLKCDQFEWPEGLVRFRHMPEFTEKTIPEGLQNDHMTKRGVWGKIILLEGELTYEPEQGEAWLLTREQCGVVVPEMKHRLQARGHVRFFVEFYKCSVDDNQKCLDDQKDKE